MGGLHRSPIRPPAPTLVEPTRAVVLGKDPETEDAATELRESAQDLVVDDLRQPAAPLGRQEPELIEPAGRVCRGPDGMTVSLGDQHTSQRRGELLLPPLQHLLAGKRVIAGREDVTKRCERGIALD